MPEFTVKDSGARQEYDSGMVRDLQDGKPMFTLLWPEGVPFDEQFLTRAAMHMTKGAGKYGLRNWEKANSQEELDRFRESGLRHHMQYLAGETDEDHAAATLFNLLAAVTLEWRLSRKPGMLHQIFGPGELPCCENTDRHAEGGSSCR